MKRYGLRIGTTGVEFPSLEDRQKAINIFTKGTDVNILSTGIKYSDGTGNFSVYDRDNKEITTICSACYGEFLIETCFQRKHQRWLSYEKKYSELEAFICDACFAQGIKGKEVFDAKELLKKGEEDV